ncbi:flavanone 3-dioxygenase 3 [Impatiens glandulifera]|uniref:flavanone 3-dioxygenase 3 n=1 Tax=Impatiens glandulifera TaxID=253017 RepID=UPI001FB0AD87|nr:flavanone 3-dioxygenase 3 [Impatiens glandulifera]
MGESSQEKGLSYVPHHPYNTPLANNLSSNPIVSDIPLIDISGLFTSTHLSQRGLVVRRIMDACRRYGFFQIINHGIEQSTMDEAISMGTKFFELPNHEKEKLMSSNVHKPVRYCTSIMAEIDKVRFWRVFLKHYAHPLQEWLGLWPNNPPEYSEKMGKYAVEVRNVVMKITGAITEGLGLGPIYMRDQMEQGMQIMIINGYPPCPNPSLALGLPPHTDYSSLTIVLQSEPGLEIFDRDDNIWKLVPNVKGALQVNVGDQIEVLSNGSYKGVIHRAIVNDKQTRVSVTSLHSLALEEKMVPARELVDEEHPIGYKESSLNDFLNFLSKIDINKGNNAFIDTLKISE